MSFMSTHSLLAFPPSRHIARENHCHSFAYAHTTMTGNIYFAVEWSGRGNISLAVKTMLLTMEFIDAFYAPCKQLTPLWKHIFASCTQVEPWRKNYYPWNHPLYMKTFWINAHWRTMTWKCDKHLGTLHCHSNQSSCLINNEVFLWSKLLREGIHSKLIFITYGKFKIPWMYK